MTDPNSPTPSPTTLQLLAFAEFVEKIDKLHTEFYANGKSPALFAIPGLWNDLMRLWAECAAVGLSLAKVAKVQAHGTVAGE